MRMCAVWSESALSTWRNFALLVIHRQPSEASYRAAWKRRLILGFAVCICPKVRFLTLPFIILYSVEKQTMVAYDISSAFNMYSVLFFQKCRKLRVKK